MEEIVRQVMAADSETRSFPAGTVSGCGESGYHRTEEKDDECSSIRPGPQGHTGGAFQK